MKAKGGAVKRASILWAFAVSLVLVGGTASAQTSGEFTVPERTLVTNGRVDAILPVGDRIYLGGNFTTVGPRTGPTARISIATGHADLDVAQVSGWVSTGGSPKSATVYATVADGSGGFYVGGEFTHVGGKPRSNIAHVRGNGKVDPEFKPVVSGHPTGYGVVRTMVLAGDRLFIGGTLTAVDGHMRGGHRGVRCTDR